MEDLSEPSILPGRSGADSTGSGAGMRTGFFDQSTNLGCEISYSTVNAFLVAYGSDGPAERIFPRKPSESDISCATSFHLSRGLWWNAIRSSSSLSPRMVYFTLALSVPSGVMVASTFTRCVDENGSSPEIFIQQDSSAQFAPSSSAFLPRKSGRITPQGATSRSGSR